MATFVAGSALVADKSCYFILLPRALVYHFHDNYSKCLGTHVCFTGKKRRWMFGVFARFNCGSVENAWRHRLLGRMRNVGGWVGLMG